MLDLSDLPDELQDGQGEAMDKPMSEADMAAHYKRLDDLGTLIGGKRDAVVKHRKESGIEDVWTACEEAYAGIDEMNRSDTAGGQPWRKPTSPSGPLTRGTGKEDEARSTVFIRLTTRYVDMAASKVKEKALPIGGMPFQLEPSPEPDLVDVATGEQDGAQAAQPAAYIPPAPTPAPAMAQAAPNPATAVPAALTASADAAQQAITKAKASAEKAATRIWDWLEEARYGKQIRRVIDDSARIGVGVLKGPFPQGTTERALSQEGDAVALEIVERTYPGVTWVDPWNFFPAPNCGEDIHDGDHVFERSYISEGKLRSLKDLREPGGLPVYLAECIDKVILEGPDKQKTEAQNGNQKLSDKKGMYELWEYTGELTRADMIALNALGAKDLPDDVMYCDAIVTLVNDTVIRAQFNPLAKSGRFPFRTFPWSRRAGHWAGVGVGEQVSVPQRMVNAGTRAWMNNAGVSSGVQLVFDSTKIAPSDKSYTIGGGIKLWEAVEGVQDVRTLMAAIEIPNLGQELKAIVDYAFQLAEELSNIPLVSQGRDGPTTPQTFGQAELQNTNGNTLLRSIADTLDNEVIDPLVNDYYEWLLLDPDVPDDEKGDFRIIATGCQAMVEKAIQEQTLLMLGQMTLNPAFELDPAKWAQNFVKSKRIDPEELRYSDDEIQRIKNTPPPDAPVVAAAKINAAARIHEADMDGTVKREIAANEHDRGVAYEQALAQQDATRLQLAERELQLKYEIAVLENSTKRGVSIQEVKAELAQTAMKLHTQTELSRDALAVEVHKHHVAGAMPEQALTPPTEPIGRASPGESFAE
jgi:hypothetical protein